MNAARCDECGAPVLPGGSCRDHLHELLYIEAAIPGGPGEVAHFYAVAAYGIQHPAGMGYTIETVSGLRSQLEHVLSHTADISDVRRRVRFAAGQAGRVTRRDGDRVPRWAVERWPMTACDVASGGTEAYAERVEEWARSVVAAVDGLEP